MHKMKLTLVALALTALGCGGRTLLAEEGGHGHDHDAAGPNGGEVQELGDKDDTHVELVHDHPNGKVTLYLLAKDRKTPVAIKTAPLINVVGKAGNKQVAMTPSNPVDGAAFRWEASDEAFKADPIKGRISIELNGKKHQVKLDAHEGHGH